MKRIGKSVIYKSGDFGSKQTTRCNCEQQILRNE